MRLRKYLDLVYDTAGYAAAFFVFLIFAAMIAQTVMREVGLSTGGTDDLVAWFSAAAFFLALAHAFRHGDFVRVSLLLERLGERGKRVMETAALAVATVFTAYLAYWAVRYVYESWQYREMSTGVIIVPIWVPQLSFSVGAVLLFIAVADQLVLVLRGGKPVYVAALEERHARGDYSEDY
jgi:TRAP-type C4-dicarboxylate transport system permease small subunit